MATILLASQSPRRAELLQQIGVEFETQPVDIDESAKSTESPDSLALRLAEEKAEAGWQTVNGRLPALGSDTVVAIDGLALGKPNSRQDGLNMLQSLSGRSHKVHTGVALWDDQGCHSILVTTDVTFKPLSKAEIDWYWQTQEPLDKAGAYGIQGKAGQFITAINGSYSAVVGLPLYETAQLLQQAGLLTYEG